MSKAKIDVCTSYDEFNSLLSKARPKNSVVIAGMYNSLVNRILIGDHTKPGTKTIERATFVNVVFDTATVVQGYLYSYLRTLYDSYR